MVRGSGHRDSAVWALKDPQTALDEQSSSRRAGQWICLLQQGVVWEDDVLSLVHSNSLAASLPPTTMPVMRFPRPQSCRAVITMRCVHA